VTSVHAVIMRLFDLPRISYDRRHRVLSQDGWPLAIYEYDPRGPSRSAVPVLCIHGTNCRYSVFDGGANFGLAPYLARQGFRVFALDLRGRGLSAPRGRLKRAVVLIGRGWTLDDFLYKDLPAAFEFTLRSTGARQLDVIGHSLGGMLLLEWLAETGDERVRKVVTVGAGDAPAMLLPLPHEPRRGHKPQRKVNVGLLLAPFALSAPYTPVHWGARLAALALTLASEAVRTGWVDPVLMTLLNPNNMDAAQVQTFLARSLSGISARKFWSFGKLVRKLQQATPAWDRHRHPTLLLAGASDGLVPVASVQQTYARTAHPASRMIELSLNHGYAADYGHVDLLLGRHVEREVFPLIEAWLTDRL
jgi:pimeloyl-ACP methyl ester carboxylesterase